MDSLMNETYEECSHILHHISTHRDLPIDWQDLEVLAKTALLNMERQKISKDDTHLLPSTADSNKYPKFVTDLTLQSLFSTGILKTPLSTYNAVILDNLIKHINTKLSLDIDIKTVGTSNNNEVESNKRRQKLYTILGKLYLLPPNKIDIALERILLTIDFNTLGQVFCEPESSIYFEKCVILEDMLCSTISMPTSEADMAFLNSIFRNVAMSRKSQELYRQCLRNEVFRESIFVFFKSALENFSLRHIAGQKRVGDNYLDGCLESEMLFTFSLSLKMRKLGGDIKQLLLKNYKDLVSYIDLLYL